MFDALNNAACEIQSSSSATAEQFVELFDVQLAMVGGGVGTPALD